MSKIKEYAHREKHFFTFITSICLAYIFIEIILLSRKHYFVKYQILNFVALNYNDWENND